MSTAAVEICDVTKSYADAAGKSNTVLDNVSFSLSTGSVSIISGRSGSGKTTLLNLISALITPDSGTVTVNGIDVSGLRGARADTFRARHIGYIFQTFNLISPLTVRENIYVPSILSGCCTDSGAVERAQTVLDNLGLSGHGDKPPHQLSAGQRQRVAIGRTLFKGPDIILADEPTASLDREAAEMVMNIFSTLRERGSVIIVATHDPLFREIGPDMVYDIEKRGTVS